MVWFKNLSLFLFLFLFFFLYNGIRKYDILKKDPLTHKMILKK